MNKEPVGLYIFRFMLGLGLFAFMAMLYYSSLLLEEDVNDLQQDMRQLKNEIFYLTEETQSVKDEVLQTILSDQQNRQEILKAILKNHQEIKRLEDAAEQGTLRLPSTDRSESDALSLNLNLSKKNPALRNRPHVNQDLPNLLEEDPFYTKILREMLGRGFKPHGMRQGASVGKPDHLHPMSNWSSVSSWNSMCNVSVATNQFGKFETLAPDMALKLEERREEKTGALEYWVHLRDDVYWQPLNPDHFPDDFELAPHFLRKHKVTAHDFKFRLDAVLNTHVQESGAASLRNYLGDIDELKVIDDLTFVVRWRAEEVEIPDDGTEKRVKYTAKSLTGSLSPLPRWVYQYFPDGSKIIEEDSATNTYQTNSVWAQNFSQHWAKNVVVSCGPWVFDGMTDQAIRFKRNPEHYNPLSVLVEELEIRFKESPDQIWQEFKAGKLDTYTLRPEQLIELENFLQTDEYKAQEEAGYGIRRLDYVARSYNYIGWNQATPYFRSKRVRRAMSMAIDRQRIIQQNLNRMGVMISGPFFIFSPSNNPEIRPWPFDLQEAKQLLEEEGWYDSDGDGIRDKLVDGKRVPFRFSLTYYVKNPTSKSNSEYVATALRELGIDCQLNGVDIADLSNTWDEKSFDAIYLGWALGSPPEEPKQLWHSSGAKEKGSSNAVGFQNGEADRIIFDLQYEYNLNKRRQLYHRFHEIIHEESPYAFLYTPKSILLYRDYVKNVFIPAERQDLIPGANVAEPNSAVFWLQKPREAR